MLLRNSSLRVFIVAALTAVFSSVISAGFLIPAASASGGSLTVPTHAVGAVYRDNLQLSAPERAAVDAFYAEIESRLPDRMKSYLPTPITVDFTDLGSGDELPLPPCTIDQMKAAASLEHTIYGMGVKQAFTNDLASKVVMNKAFLKEIINGKAKARSYECGHRSSFQLAQATLIHETSHIYDSFRIFDNDAETKEFIKCRQARMETDPRNRNPRIIVSPSCYNLINRRSSVSDRMPFLFLSNWKTAYDQKNFKIDRSPDPYEYTNSKEAFAVNMEFFLLDPQFQCRRPALNEFLEGYFGTKPFAKNCTTPTLIGYDTRPEELNLDPARIWQVQYLFAEPGTDMSSHWGHSMIRLIMCAPTRKTVGPECMEDTPFHVILSFRANVEDLNIDSWKGITGQYPSEMFIMSLSEVLEEYTLNELRSMKSYPVRMSDAEKNRFVLHALEVYWEYRGKYFFITQNCAHESFDLLKAAIWDEKFEADSIMTPKGLLEKLQKNNRLLALPAENSPDYKYYFFQSFKDKLAEATSKLHGAFPEVNDKKIEEYLYQMSGAERAAYVNSLLVKTADADKKKAVAANFYVIEVQRYRFDSSDMQQVLFDVLNDTTGANKQLADAGVDLNLIHKLNEKNALIRFKNHVYTGYGIAQETDFRLDWLRLNRDASYKFMTDQRPMIEKAIGVAAPSESAAVAASQEVKKNLLLVMRGKIRLMP